MWKIVVVVVVVHRSHQVGVKWGSLNFSNTRVVSANGTTANVFGSSQHAALLFDQITAKEYARKEHIIAVDRNSRVNREVRACQV